MGFGFINALGVVLQKNRKIFLKNENLEEEICTSTQDRTIPKTFKHFSRSFERPNLTLENAVLRFAVKNQKLLWRHQKVNFITKKFLSVAKALFDLQKYKNFELIFVCLKEERPNCLFFENRKISKKSTLGGLDNYSSCGYTIEQHV